MSKHRSHRSGTNGILQEKASKDGLWQPVAQRKSINIRQCQKALAFAMFNGKDLLLLAILLYAGVRRGEMLGLRWEDIDFDRKLIHVRRQITFINNRPVEKTTKSASGLREVPMLPELEKILLDNKPKDAIPSHYVVDGEEALSERSFRNTWERICKKVHMPKGVTPHVLRHTLLTQLQAAGHVDIKTLQSIAGHSKITMTMNTYVHKDTENVEKASCDNAGLFTRA